MHVCLFDIDGTLLNTGGAGQAAMEAALLQEFGLDQPVEGISTAGRTDRAITADLFSYFGIDADETVWQRFLAAYLQQLPQHLQECDGAVLPGVVELLCELDGRENVVLGLLTGNFRRGADLKLQRYGLHAYFGFGGFGDDHDDRDDVARAALSEVRRHVDATIDLGRIWVIGDTPADVRCARAIGANAFVVATGVFPRETLEAEQPDHLLADFSDPAPLLRLLD